MARKLFVSSARVKVRSVGSNLAPPLITLPLTVPLTYAVTV